jgi:hypothetical protein
MTFSGLMLDTIPGLTADGIDGNLEIMAIYDDTILATLDIQAAVEDISDISGVEFVRTVTVTDFQAEYFLPKKAKDLDPTDEFFVIDAVHMTIDVTDLLTQAILLQEPLLTLAPGESRSVGEDNYRNEE